MRRRQTTREQDTAPCFASDLDIDPMTLIFESDLDICCTPTIKFLG